MVTFGGLQLRNFTAAKEGYYSRYMPLDVLFIIADKTILVCKLC